MIEKKIISTGNLIVDEIGQLNITGNVIPEIWYQTVINENGKVNYLAILLLADIVYWYSPSEIRNETSLEVSYTKRFRDEHYLQRSYEQICQKFNVSKKQARDAIVFLEEIGVIVRHFRTITTATGPLPNVMFLELIPSVLKDLTYPQSEGGIYKNVDTPLQKNRDIPTKKHTGVNENVDTNTKTNTETTTETTTTTKPQTDDSVVVELKEVFKGLTLSKKDMLSIANAANNDIDKCKKAKELLVLQRTKIENIVGWLIKAVTDDYQLQSMTSVSANNSNFHFSLERDYDYDVLERDLLRRHNNNAYAS